MDMNDIKQLDKIAVNQFIICEESKSDDGQIALPDGSKLKTGFSFLKVLYVADDCENIEVGDLCILHPRPMKYGQFDIGHDKFFMAHETEIALVLRKKPKKKGVDNAT